MADYSRNFKNLMGGLNEIFKEDIVVGPQTDFATESDLMRTMDLNSGDPGNEGKATRIPLPDYKDPNSRLNYAKQFSKKYGSYVEKRGDTPLRFNEKPYFGSDTSFNLSKKAATPLNIDPLLLYVSNMEEGQSGLYLNDEGKLKWTGNKDYPVSGLWNFGLDSFAGKVGDLIKKGYLPPDFEEKYVAYEENPDVKESAYFANTDAAIQAAAAMLKTHYDDVDRYTQTKNIKLSPKARDFFALASFNGGEGVGRQMITDYNNNGLLKNDSFMEKRPTKGEGLKETSYKDVYDNVKRRIVMTDALRNEGYINEPESTAQSDKKTNTKNTK